MPAEQSNLSARDIFVAILKGSRVRVHVSKHEFTNLKSNLNVLKSRDKKLYEKFGFDYDKAIIKSSNEAIGTYTLWIEKPKEDKKYPVFVILTDTNPSNPTLIETMDNSGNVNTSTPDPTS